MEQGSLGELYLTRSVTKHIRKHNKAVIAGSGVGKDYTLVKTDSGYMIQSEAVGETPYIAWVKALNNFHMSGANVSAVRVCYMLPVDVCESQLKEYASQFNALADKCKVQIAGGNTRISSAYSRASFLVEAFGTVADDGALELKAKPDYQIVMVGYTGILGTNLIVDEKAEELKKRFAASYVADCRFREEDYNVAPMVQQVMQHCQETGVVYMHDLSYGGLYGGLWQLGEALKLGVSIDHRSIPIRQETVEVCNYFDINPYMLEGTGAFLAVARDGDGLVKQLLKSGYVASRVGRLTQNKDRVVVLNSEGEKRFLAPVKGDEIYKVISAY